MGGTSFLFGVLNVKRCNCLSKKDTTVKKLKYFWIYVSREKKNK